MSGWVLHFEGEYHRFHAHNLLEHVYPGGRRIGTYSVLSMDPVQYCFIPVGPAPLFLRYTLLRGGRELQNDAGDVVPCALVATT